MIPKPAVPNVIYLRIIYRDYTINIRVMLRKFYRAARFLKDWASMKRLYKIFTDLFQRVFTYFAGHIFRYAGLGQFIIHIIFITLYSGLVIGVDI